MPVRVRYRASDLGEGTVEVFHQANSYEADEWDRLILMERWIEVDPETGEEQGKKKRQVGMVPAGRWDSVVVLEDEKAQDGENA